MSKEKIESFVELNFIRRYPPQGIFADGTGFSKNPTFEQHKDRYTLHESITDKESYRLNLASARGAISALTPEQKKNNYLFPDGKYDKSLDISHILRKDLTLVEIDDYIQRCKDNREFADEKLESYLNSTIEKLESKRDKVVENSPKVGDSSSGQSSVSSE